MGACCPPWPPAMHHGLSMPAAAPYAHPQGIIKHLRKVLSRHPPPAPTEAAIRLVEAVGKLQNFVHR